MKFLLAALALLAFSSHALAVEWKYFYSYDDADVYFDNDSSRILPSGLLSYSILTNYKRPRNKSNGTSYLSTRSTHLLNCKTIPIQVKVDSLEEYSGSNAAGQMVFRMIPVNIWFGQPSDSVDSAVAKIICR